MSCILVFWKARSKRKDRFALQRIDLFSLSGHIFIQQPFSDCPARAASACSRRSGRYCVSLMSSETPLSECPEAPYSRLSGRYCISLMSLETPLSGCPEAPCSQLSRRYSVSLTSSETPLTECPEAPCSRRSGRYCVSLTSLATPLSECPEAPQRLSAYVIQSPYSITAAKLLHPVADR